MSKTLNSDLFLKLFYQNKSPERIINLPISKFNEDALRNKDTTCIIFKIKLIEFVHRHFYIEIYPRVVVKRKS